MLLLRPRVSSDVQQEFGKKKQPKNAHFWTSECLSGSAVIWGHVPMAGNCDSVTSCSPQKKKVAQFCNMHSIIGKWDVFIQKYRGIYCTSYLPDSVAQPRWLNKMFQNEYLWPHRGPGSNHSLCFSSPLCLGLSDGRLLLFLSPGCHECMLDGGAAPPGQTAVISFIGDPVSPQTSLRWVTILSSLCFHPNAHKGERQIFWE